MGAGQSVPLSKAKEWEGLANEIDSLCRQQRRLIDQAAPGGSTTATKGPEREGTGARREGTGVRRQSSILKMGGERRDSQARRDSQGSAPAGRRSSSVCFTGNKPPEEIEAAVKKSEKEAQKCAQSGTNMLEASVPGACRSPAVASFTRVPMDGSVPLTPGNMVVEDGILQPKIEARRQNREEMKKVKQRRKEFFESYHTECASNSPIKCTYLGHLCAALSYILAAKSGEFADYPMKNRVTIEDIFFTCHLPLHYIVNTSITLAELADIAQEFVDHDPRFRDLVRIEACHMDPVLVDAEVDQGDRANETGDRGPPSLAIFRKSLEEDMQGNSAIRVFCFDPFVVEQSKVHVDDTDESDDDYGGEVKEFAQGETSVQKQTGPGSATGDAAAPSHSLPNECINVYKKQADAPQSKHGRKNRGWFSLCTEFNGTQSVISLADAELDTEVHLKPHDAPLPALYSACCSRDGFNKRMRGFIRFSLKGTSKALKEEEELESRILFCPDLYNGKGPQGIPLASVDPNISTHIVAFAYGVHLIQGMQGEDAGVGTNCRNICQAMEFPLSVTCNFHMTLLQSYAYFQAFLTKSGLSEKMYAVAQPMERKVDTDDAPPTMSIMDFENVLCQVMERSMDATQPSIAMLLCYEVGCAHNVLGLTPKGTESHWGILFSYDEDKQMCAVLDVFPKKYTRIWYTSLTRLHKALMGRGYIMLYKRDEDEAGLGQIDMGRQDTMIRNKLQSVKLPPSFGMKYVSAFEFPPQIMSVTVYAIVFNKMKKYCMVRDLVHWLDCDPSFVVADNLSIRDLARVGNNFLNNAPGGWRDQWSIEVVNFDTKLDGTPRVSEEMFGDLLRENAKDKESELIVQCSKAVLQEHGGGAGGEYCVVVQVNEETRSVTLADVNPQIYFRHTSIPIRDLYRGICAVDRVNLRKRGIITVRKKAMPKALRYDEGRNLNMLKVPSAHPFKTPIANHLSAIAFALTSLGQPCSPEEVFYTAFTVLAGARYRRGSAIFPWQQLKISLHDLKERLTVTAVASMITKYQEGLGKSLRGETLVSASKDEFREKVIGSIKETAEPPLMMVVYRADLVHDMKLAEQEEHWKVGCALVKSFAADTGVVTCADSNPTRYGDFWQCHVDKLYDATDLSDKEKEENGIVMVVQGEEKPKPPAKKPGEPESAAPIQFGAAAF